VPPSVLAHERVQALFARALDVVNDVVTERLAAEDAAGGAAGAGAPAPMPAAAAAALASVAGLSYAALLDARRAAAGYPAPATGGSGLPVPRDRGAPRAPVGLGAFGQRGAPPGKPAAATSFGAAAAAAAAAGGGGGGGPTASLSFKEVLDRVAAEHGLAFLPHPRGLKSASGAPVYHFGDVPVYLQHGVAFAEMPGGKAAAASGGFKPVSVDALLELALQVQEAAGSRGAKA
jgi:hypothetical protein